MCGGGGTKNNWGNVGGSWGSRPTLDQSVIAGAWQKGQPFGFNSYALPRGYPNNGLSGTPTHSTSTPPPNPNPTPTPTPTPTPIPTPTPPPYDPGYWADPTTLAFADQGTYDSYLQRYNNYRAQHGLSLAGTGVGSGSYWQPGNGLLSL